MDSIKIINLEIYAYHGVCPEENVLGQKFLLSMELFMDLNPAGQQDDLSLSVSYAEVCKFVEKVFQNKQFKLLEACAEHLCNEILLHFGALRQIDLELKKPWAPIGCHLDYVSVKVSRKWHTAFISLGSNLGEKEKNLQKAVEQMNTLETRVGAVSKFYPTAPWGKEDQPEFLNACVRLDTLLSPYALLTHLQGIEACLKREHLEHWGPRTIDLDILLYDDIITEDAQLTIPHPYMAQRAFVLEPLAEIAPNAYCPLCGKRILEILEMLNKR